MYRVIERFADLQDDKRIYNAGDTFPRDGLKVAPERMMQLTSCNNRIGRPIIEYIPDKKESDKNAVRTVRRNKELV